MSLLRNREARFSRMLPKIGGFILFAALSLFVLLTALGFTRQLFVPTTELHTSLPDGRGIRVGTAVMLRGFRIGQVQSLALDEAARVDARLAIESRYLVWLGSDSLVRRGRDNLLGDTYLEVEPRRSGTPLAPGEALRFAGGGEMDDVIAEAQAKVFPLLENADALVRQISDPEGRWQATLLGVQQATQRLEATLDEVNQTMRQTQALSREGRQALQRDLQPVLADSRLLLQEARQTSSTLTALATDVQAALPELTLKIGRNLDAIQQLTPEVSRTTQTGTTLMQSAQESLDGLSRSWPVQGLIGQPPSPVLEQDSHD